MHHAAEVGDSQTTELFPLQLSPIESFFCAEDRPSHPMAFTIQLDFKGVVNRPVLEATLREALERHPLLGSVIQRGKQLTLWWKRAEGLLPYLDWGDLDQPIVCPRGERIDLRQEVGLRIWVRQGPELAIVTLQFAHACTDGIGAYRFIGDWLALYGRQTCGTSPPPELLPLDANLLLERKMRVTELAYRGHLFRLIGRGLYQFASMFGASVMKLNAPHSRLSTPTPFPGVCSHSFDRAQYECVRKRSMELGCTTNDLLMAVVLRTLAEWNARHARRFNGRALRIVMPTDMRDGDDFLMPAANLVSYTLITRRPKDCQDVRDMVGGIRDETALIKHNQSGKAFNDALAAAQLAPWLLPLMLSGERCLSSAVLSNVGDPSRRFTAKFPRSEGRVVAGDLRLEGIGGAPPMRPKTRATFSIVNYLRKLTISVRCDPQYFRLEDTEQLLDLLIEYLQPFAS